MAAANIGIVYYADDPDKKVFRRVLESYPGEFDDAGRLARIQAEATTANLDPARAAVIEMVASDDPRANAFGGTTDAPATTNGLDANGNPWPPVTE